MPLTRILKSADFRAVLAQPSTSRSAHFALHYSATSPASTSRVTKVCEASTIVAGAGLSTGSGSVVDRPVDILWQTGELSLPDPCEPEHLSSFTVDDAASPPEQVRVWIGLVVPKRHAKRSVTRTLMKRQIRVALEDARDRLQPGMWVVRLRAPFGKADYPSASSTALKRVVREELTSLVAHGVRKRDRAF